MFFFEFLNPQAQTEPQSSQTIKTNRFLMDLKFTTDVPTEAQIEPQRS